MDKQVILHSLVLLAGVFISAVSQVILKKRASKKSDSIIQEYLNFPVIFAYFLFFAATLMSVFAYRVIPMMLGVVLDSTSYIFVTISGMTFFNEKMNAKKLTAILLIIAGIIVFSLR